MTLELGRLLISMTWADWALGRFPLHVNGHQRGALWLIGPLRLGWFPPTREIR